MAGEVVDADRAFELAPLEPAQHAPEFLDVAFFGDFSKDALAIAEVRARISEACSRIARVESDVTLVAVSKRQPDERLHARHIDPTFLDGHPIVQGHV